MNTSLHIGDVVVWAWAAKYITNPTRLKVVDISLSGRDYDVVVQSENSGQTYEEREEDLLVVQLAPREVVAS